MRDLAIEIGQRMRNIRLSMHLSQEELAEICGLHPTYIGQLERGEKNATLESISKVAKGLGIPLGRLLENTGCDDAYENYPMQAYRIIMSENEHNQERLVEILKNVVEYGKD